jgi:hypothetical protein
MPMMRRKRLRSSFWRAVSDLGAKQEFGMPKDPFIANAAMTTYLQSLPVIDGAPLIKEWDKLFRHVHSRHDEHSAIASRQRKIGAFSRFPRCHPCLLKSPPGGNFESVVLCKAARFGSAPDRFRGHASRYGLPLPSHCLLLRGGSTRPSLYSDNR